MYYTIRCSYDSDECFSGYHASSYEHDETPPVWHGPTVATVEEAKASAGIAIRWSDPDPDSDPDLIAFGVGA